MTTGVETAGLVLAAIPLVLASLEKGIAITKRHRKYQQELKRLLAELRTENTMCVNSMTMLLIGVLDHKGMKEFLENPGENCWKDDQYEKRLRDRLGFAYKSYIETVTEIKMITNNLQSRLRLDESGQPQLNGERSFKEHYKRIVFSLIKSDYDDLMTRLRHCNTALYRMTTQTISIEALKKTKDVAHGARLPSFDTINDHAQCIYSTLASSWKCPCYANHSVSLRLDSRINANSDQGSEEWDQDSPGQPFHVLFRNERRRDWCTNVTGIEESWMWEEADVHAIEKKPQSNEPLESRKPKSVRFKSQAKKRLKLGSDLDADSTPIEDLCTAFHGLQKTHRNVCLSLLASEVVKQRYDIRVYPFKEAPQDPETWSMEPLCDVLQDSKFTRQDRLRLAVTLASSVLQLHDTPWLIENWDGTQIFFIKHPERILYGAPFVTMDHRSTWPSQPSLVPKGVVKTVIRNQSLFALGVSLIELWYGKPLGAFHTPEDGRKDTGDITTKLITDFTTANRLVENLYSEAGDKYSDAVRRCIRCDFDHRAKDLQDVAFQKAVYRGVVSQLKENLDFLFRLGDLGKES